jgi:hypothetical protein
LTIFLLSFSNEASILIFCQCIDMKHYLYR